MAKGSLGTSVSEVSFGDVNLGESTSSTVTITNNHASTNLVFSSATTLVGEHTSDYSITSDGCNGQTLTSGQTCTISVSFTPSTSGNRWASLRLTHDQAWQDTIALVGEGRVPLQTIANDLLSDSSCISEELAGELGITEQLKYARRFRDEYLEKSAMGRYFLEAYYRSSPSMKEWAREYPAVHWALAQSLVVALDGLENWMEDKK